MAKNLWTPKKTFCGLSYSTLRENWSNNFFHWKNCLFFQKKCVFNNHLRSRRTDLKTFKVFVWIPRGPLKIVSWGLSDSTKRRKWAKTFYHCEISCFEMFVSVDLVDPKELILSIAQYLLRNFVDAYKLVPDVSHTRGYKKFLA